MDSVFIYVTDSGTIASNVAMEIRDKKSLNYKKLSDVSAFEIFNGARPY
jgi:hypothetical protein